MEKTKRNRDREAVIQAAVNGSPYYQYIGMQVVGYDDRGSIMEMPVIAEHMNLWGVMHGGAVSSLVDSSCGTSVGPFLAEGEEKLVTFDLRIQFFKPIREGTLTAYGRMVHRTSRFIISESEVYDREKELVARGTGVHAVIRAKGNG